MRPADERPAAARRNPTVVLMGALDTKGLEYRFLAEEIRAGDADVLVVDVGILGEPMLRADVSREEVARAAAADLAELRGRADQGAAVTTMAHGAAVIARRLHDEGRFDALFGVGGTSGTALISHAMRALPVGVPKLLVSTCAAGDVSHYVGSVDLSLMYSVVDIAGLNRLSRRVLGNAAAAAAGMARAAWQGSARAAEAEPHQPLVGATMFGNTMGGVTAARQVLEARGHEVITFHATGTGGQSMETLLRDGFIASLLDFTTTELAAELLGSPWAARPERLEVAVRIGAPQVVSLGALDMATFGPPESVPEDLRNRLLYQHNPNTTLVRTSPEECAELGRRLVERLGAAGPLTSLFIPLRGFSRLGSEGRPFWDPEADRALIEAVKQHASSGLDIREFDTTINDPRFGEAAGETLDEHYRAWVAAQREKATA
jgi:uncharacterized protein (UPF0261 family)